MPRGWSSRCPIPGCSDGTTINGLVCTAHGVQIWAHIEKVRDRSGFHVAEAVARHRDREERQAEQNARDLAATRAEGVIYFLELDEKIKVGWTGNLDQRMKSYPPHSRLIVSYPASRADERDLHRSLRLSLVAGREWYTRTPQVMTAIRDVELQNAQRHAAQRAAYEAAHPPPPPLPRPSGKPCKPTRSEVIRAQLYGPFDDEEQEAEGA